MRILLKWRTSCTVVAKKTNFVKNNKFFTLIVRFFNPSKFSILGPFLALFEMIKIIHNYKKWMFSNIFFFKNVPGIENCERLKRDNGVRASFWNISRKGEGYDFVNFKCERDTIWIKNTKIKLKPQMLTVKSKLNNMNNLLTYN